MSAKVNHNVTEFGQSQRVEKPVNVKLIDRIDLADAKKKLSLNGRHLGSPIMIYYIIDRQAD